MGVGTPIAVLWLPLVQRLLRCAQSALRWMLVRPRTPLRSEPVRSGAASDDCEPSEMARKGKPGGEWGYGKWAVGDRCVWRGITLVCCTGHYAGDAADHPWDPGHGWPVERAAALWAPDGDVETARLRAMLIDKRGDLDIRLRCCIGQAAPKLSVR